MIIMCIISEFITMINRILLFHCAAFLFFSLSALSSKEPLPDAAEQSRSVTFSYKSRFRIHEAQAR